MYRLPREAEVWKCISEIKRSCPIEVSLISLILERDIEYLSVSNGGWDDLKDRLYSKNVEMVSFLSVTRFLLLKIWENFLPKETLMHEMPYKQLPASKTFNPKRKCLISQKWKEMLDLKLSKKLWRNSATGLTDLMINDWQGQFQDMITYRSRFKWNENTSNIRNITNTDFIFPFHKGSIIYILFIDPPYVIEFLSVEQ